MQKKCVFILFCFFMNNNVVAQLPQDLARFTQTLKNLAAKLPAGVGGPGIITVPASGRVTLPDGKSIEAPEGSTVKIGGDGFPIVIVPAVGGKVTFLNSRGWVEVSRGSVTFLDDGSFVNVPVGGSTVIVYQGNTVLVKPTLRPVPPVKPDTYMPPTGIDVDVPADGIVNLPNGEILQVPADSDVRIYSDGLRITVPTSGGDINLPRSGGNIGIANEFNATLQLPDGTIQEISRGKYAEIPMEGVVKVIPKNTLPSTITVLGSKKRTIPVPPDGGYIKIWDDETIHVPNDSTIEQSHDGELVIRVSGISEGDITKFSQEILVGLREGSSPVTLQLSDGRKGELALVGHYIIIPPGVAVKVTPSTKS